MSKSSIVRAAIAATLSVSLGLAAWAAATSTKDGAFTAAQAERGKIVYDRSCKNCHLEDFYRERLPRFEGKPVSTLFEAISTTMPADNVGSLATSEYLDVLAYIFSITGSTAGQSELTTDNMETIKIAPLN